jgi:tetratricopeptide (TPR) repeat protein
LERRKEGEELDELERQLLEAESRLAVLEAQAVPLTAEEAALVDRGTNIEVAVVRKPADPATAKRVQQLPPGAGPLIAQAQRAIEQGRLQEAQERLLEVLQQDEDNVFTLANLAAVELELKRLDEAEKYLNKALSVDPEDAGSLYLFGVLKYQEENYDAALDALSKAARKNPEKPETQYFLGLTLLQQGNRKPAEAALRKAIQLRPNWSNAHYQLAVVYATQNPPFKELAQWHYDKAIENGASRNFDLEKVLESDETKPPAP